MGVDDMRKSFMTCTAAMTALAIPLFVAARASAMTIAVPASLGKAIHEVALVDDASHICRGGWRGRRCWGARVPYGGYLPYQPSYAYSFYRPQPYYAYGYYQLESYPAWGWGYRQPWWW